MQRTTLSREAYSEIRSGRLSIQEARKKYKRDTIQLVVVARTTRKLQTKMFQNWKTSQKIFMDLIQTGFFSDAEKQILEYSGCVFYQQSQENI